MGARERAKGPVGMGTRERQRYREEPQTGRAREAGEKGRGMGGKRRKWRSKKQESQEGKEAKRPSCAWRAVLRVRA